MGLAAHSREADRARQEPVRLASERDILGDGELGQQAQFLVDERHAFAPRVRRARNVGLAPLDEDCAFVAVEEAREHTHQRGLAGPVFADEAVDLARVQIEIDAIDSPRRPEAHRNAAQRHEALSNERPGLSAIDQTGGHGFLGTAAINWDPDSRALTDCRQDFQ